MKLIFVAIDISLIVHTFYNSLGSLDNSVQSFKLKRGYMVTFTNNSDGSGSNRGFIADKVIYLVVNTGQGLADGKKIYVGITGEEVGSYYQFKNL